MNPVTEKTSSPRPPEVAPARNHGPFAISSIFAGLTMAILSAGSSAQPPKKEDPDRIPATSIPEVAPARDAIVVDKAELQKQLGIKIQGELSVVRTKNITLHYITPKQNAAETAEQKLALAKSIEAHLVHHAKVLFGEEKVTLSSTIDVFLHTENVDVPGIGKRSGIYIGQASALESKKFKTQILGAKFDEKSEDPDAAVADLTRVVRHELLHALVRNRYPGKLISIFIDEGLAVNTEKNGLIVSRERYLELRDTKAYENYGSASRILRGLTDDKKSEEELKAAYAARALLVHFLITREEEIEKGWRRLGRFLDTLNENGIIDKELNGQTEKKFEKVIGEDYNLSLKELDIEFENYLKKITPKKKEK